MPVRLLRIKDHVLERLPNINAVQSCYPSIDLVYMQETKPFNLLQAAAVTAAAPVPSISILNIFQYIAS